MKTCITTIIKNEHQYLDEWIKYHLDLGIDHIFIFEDIDSDSHKEIVGKYPCGVSLMNIFDILSEYDKQQAIELKKTKKTNVQDLYFKNTLKYIKNNFPKEYDWCFIIDCDEFITLEDSTKTLNSIIELYKDYDAFIMSWECYGASGHIEKPNYKEGGVIDHFKKKISETGGFVDNHASYHTKTCYNLNTFKENFYKNNHQSSDFCNWCRTNFSGERLSEIYTNIYIRHYITKSLEEYSEKRKNRGYFVGISRTEDFFFKINPDMLDKKKLTMKKSNDVLVVLPYKQSGSQGNEIEITLNLWKKFCTFQNHFIVIGEFDDSIKNKFPWVEFIYYPSKEKKEGQYNPHIDIQNKFRFVMDKYADVYDGFIYITDDEYAIKPFFLKNITTTYYHAENFTGIMETPAYYWSHDKWKTRQLLDKENLPHINYTTHYPCWFEMKKMREIQDKYNLLNESYVFDDIYFNYFEHDEPILDSKIRLGIWNQRIFKNDFEKALADPKIKFMCNSVEGWSKELEEKLKKLI